MAKHIVILLQSEYDELVKKAAQRQIAEDEIQKRSCELVISKLKGIFSEIRSASVHLDAMEMLDIEICQMEEKFKKINYDRSKSSV